MILLAPKSQQDELKEWKPKLKFTFGTTKDHAFSDMKHVAEVSPLAVARGCDMSQGRRHRIISNLQLASWIRVDLWGIEKAWEAHRAMQWLELWLCGHAALLGRLPYSQGSLTRC